MSIPRSLSISISMQSLISQLCPIIDICELKLKKNNNNDKKAKMKNCENELL